MIPPEEFLMKLKLSMEEHSALLERGELLLPKGLKGKRFIKQFRKVAESSGAVTK